MPSNIRAMLTVVVVLVAAVVFYFEWQSGARLEPWLVLGLGAFMVFALWLFPEAKGTKDRET